MFNNFVSKINILRVLVFSLLILLITSLSSTFKPTTQVVFCDVGQGDGIYIRTEDGIDVLIDAGTGSQILQCLGKYMPFYDREIELTFISHPQKDHFGGYLYVIGRYKINTLVTIPVENQTSSYKQLAKKISHNNISLEYLFSDDKIDVGKFSHITFFWPTHEIIERKSRVKNLNDFSQVFLFSQGDVDILFTGDASPDVLHELIKGEDLSSAHIEILKIPHHGSKNGLTNEFLQVIQPQLSVISVGSNNQYGHPSKEVIRILEQAGSPFVSTAMEGDIILSIDDQGWKRK